MKKTINTEHILSLIDKFDTERDWQQFHTLKNLAISAAIESGELLEIFQWLNDDEIKQQLRETTFKEKIAHELADVFIYLFRIIKKLDIDIEDAISAKMKLNERKYPAIKVKGMAKKYSEY
ncbi:MAG: nucleotide pyrophosphohydrolase [Pseudomonadota bacterium]